MKTTFRLFLSCLLCLVLPLANGYGNEESTTVPANSAEQERQAGERMVLTIKDVEYAFRWCPPGVFMMGSPESEEGRWWGDYESQHQVTLSRGFWMLETPVTQGMWKAVMGGLQYGDGVDLEGFLWDGEDVVMAKLKDRPEFLGDRKPIICVSWNDAQAYIERLNDLGVAPADFKFSLPTEAQWEYACRAGTTTAFHFGDTLSQEQANFGSDWETGRTTDVGSYPANAWGLRDMHGNVWEWVQDWFGDYPSGAVTDPTGATTGSFRVVRGGSWRDYVGNCRSAVRVNGGPSDRHYSLGFRLSLVSQ